MCVLTGLVVYIIVGINVKIKWIGEWQQQGHLSKLQIKERCSWLEGLWQWRFVLLNCYVENESAFIESEIKFKFEFLVQLLIHFFIVFFQRGSMLRLSHYYMGGLVLQSLVGFKT